MLYAKIYYRVVGIMLAIFLILGLSTKSKSDSQMDEVGFTVQEIVDALNFASRTIVDGEITEVSFSTMDITDKKRDVQRIIKELNRELKQSKNKNAQKRISRDIQLHKDWLKLLPKWPIRNECYATFKVPQGADDDELQVLYGRYHLTDKRGFNQETRFFEGLYHKTTIVSTEHTADLIVSVVDPWEGNAIGLNIGSVEKSRQVDDLPLHLFGRVRFKINVNQVKKVYKADSGLLVMELALGTTKVSENRQLHRFSKLWISPKEGFSVVREEVQNKIDDKYDIEIRSYGGFKEYAGGVWYPTSLEYTRYVAGGRKRRIKRVISEVTVMIREADFNIGVPEEFFEFTLEEMKQIDILLSDWYEQPVFPDMDSRFPRLWDIIR